MIEKYGVNCPMNNDDWNECQSLRLIALAPFLLCVAACGGGGVSSSPAPAPSPTPTPTPTPTATAFTNWQAVPANGVLKLTGSSVEATYTPSAFNGTVGSYNTPGVGAVTADITYASGSPTGVSVKGTQSSVSFTTSDGSSKIRLAASPNIIKYASPSGVTSLLMVDAPSAGYSYMSYGAWAGESTTTGYINSFHAGTMTPAGAVPTGGTATYIGSSAGYYSTVNGAVNAVTSDVTLTADFGARSINYVASNTQGASSYPGLNISGTLTYNAGASNFSGTLRTPQGFGTILSGTATGSFYGPSGQEIAGAFVLNWSGGTVGQYVGAFGAKRQ